MDDYASRTNITLSYCNFWKNQLGIHGGRSSGYESYLILAPGNIEQNPYFVEPGTDYHLQQSSACIDAGKPGFASLDPDGTRNDMGAYGGPHASMTGILGPVITNLEVSSSIVRQGEEIIIRATGTLR